MDAEEAAEPEPSRRSWKADLRKGNSTQQWCTLLETAIDGRTAENKMETSPEHHRISSSSRAGRFHWHSNNNAPPQEEQPRTKSKSLEQKEQYMTEEDEEQLIYMALYRDKVDKHQDALARKAREARDAAGKERMAERKERKERERKGLPISDLVEAANAETAIQDRRLAQGRTDEELGRKTVVHTAAVNSKSAGGSLAEHFEAKRLGKLFDEWQLKQQAEADEAADTPYQSARAEGRRRRIAQLEGSTGEPRSARNGGASPRKLATKKTLGSKGPSMHPDTLERAKTQEAGQDQQLEKLWKVMTNSKVRTQSLQTEKNVSHERDNRQAPTHIEGIAPLMLAKLYQGPWRLDV